jgi:hypothetical protein
LNPMSWLEQVPRCVLVCRVATTSSVRRPNLYVEFRTSRGAPVGIRGRGDLATIAFSVPFVELVNGDTVNISVMERGEFTPDDFLGAGSATFSGRSPLSFSWRNGKHPVETATGGCVMSTRQGPWQGRAPCEGSGHAGDHCPLAHPTGVVWWHASVSFAGLFSRTVPRFPRSMRR